MRSAVVFAILIGALVAPPPAVAQATAVVDGTVVDATGSVIAGAAVVLASRAGERRTVTDGAGRFHFDNVPAGPLTVRVAFDGFAPAAVDLAAPRRGVRVVLQPVPVTETVTVLAPAPVELRSTTATRTNTPLRDVPQAVTVVSRELILDQTMRSMADVTHYVPGVGMAQGEGHRDAPIFRGNTSTSDFFVDGLRDDTQYLRDLYNVERVEVLKGPNGMIFGRGGVGGVINRITRQADWTRARELTVQGGSFGYRRLTADLGDGVNDAVALRVTGMYENSDTFRDAVDLERYGVNPTAAFAPTPNTRVTVGYEYFHDERTVDRGIPSLGGRPLDIDRSTFFGSTELNRARINLHALFGGVEHVFGSGLTIRNRLRYADYDKFYQNLVPEAVTPDRASVTLTGYNSATWRHNLFNQTDLIVVRQTGRIGHTLVAGIEGGRQVTDNRRLTAFFSSAGPSVRAILVPLASPTTTQPVEFRAFGNDADNHGVATTVSLYLQDQMALSAQVEAIVGVRYDQFQVDLLDNRTGTEFTGDDKLMSPRLALLYRPAPPLSLYASYTRAYLPRAGEQLVSLSLSNQALDPEIFRNYEVGLKWDVRPALSFTAAVFRLDHGNVVVPDPVNPGRTLLADAERVAGLELEVAGRIRPEWSVQGGYAYQDGEITRSLSSAVVAGARLGQVPRHSFSLWNKYDVSRQWGVGLGVIARSDRFVATDNRVVLPAFARVDAAVFFQVTPQVRLHVNVENLFDEHYFWAAHNNNNIAPGSPRAARVVLTTRF
jgi:catecholate siderophore receptor